MEMGKAMPKMWSVNSKSLQSQRMDHQIQQQDQEKEQDTKVRRTTSLTTANPLVLILVGGLKYTNPFTYMETLTPTAIL